MAYQIFFRQIDLTTMKQVGKGKSVDLFETIADAEARLPEFQISTPTFRQVANIGIADVIKVA